MQENERLRNGIEKIGKIQLELTGGIGRTDWTDHLNSYLEEIKEAKLEPTTQNNYKVWLSKWVEYLNRKGCQSSTRALKAYLDQGDYERSSYNRIGK